MNHKENNLFDIQHKQTIMFKIRENVKKYWCPIVIKQYDDCGHPVLDCSLIDEFGSPMTKNVVMKCISEYYGVSMEEAYIQFRRAMYDCFKVLGFTLVRYYHDQHHPKVASMATLDLRHQISDYNNYSEYSFQELFLFELFQPKIYIKEDKKKWLLQI